MKLIQRAAFPGLVLAMVACGNSNGVESTSALDPALAAQASTLLRVLTSATTGASFKSTLASLNALPASTLQEHMLGSVSNNPGEFAGQPFRNLQAKLKQAIQNSGGLPAASGVTKVGAMFKAKSQFTQADANAFVRYTEAALTALPNLLNVSSLSPDTVRRAMGVSLALAAINGKSLPRGGQPQLALDADYDQMTADMYGPNVVTYVNQNAEAWAAKNEVWGTNDFQGSSEFLPARAKPWAPAATTQGDSGSGSEASHPYGNLPPPRSHSQSSPDAGSGVPHPYGYLPPPATP